MSGATPPETRGGGAKHLLGGRERRAADQVDFPAFARPAHASILPPPEPPPAPCRQRPGSNALAATQQRKAQHPRAGHGKPRLAVEVASDGEFHGLW